jgi:PAS domain S-box-containing protein
LEALSPDVLRTVYAFTYAVLGLAVGVRALAFPSSSFRNRLLALSVFGLCHAGALWSGPLISQLDDSVPFYARTLLYQPSNIALFYFAFGWNTRRPNLAHLALLAAVFVFVLGVVSTDNAAEMQTFSRLLIDFPACACAAWVFFNDRSFRSTSPLVDRMRLFAAVGFGIYALLQFFPTPSDYLLAPILNRHTFFTVTGFEVHTVRSVAILIIAVGTLSLLNHFDSVMRRQTETALATVDAKLRKALEVTGLGSWEWDTVEDKAIWSDQMRAIFGLSSDVDPDYELFLQFVHPDDREKVAEAVRVCFEKHEPYRMNHRILATDGQIKFVDARGEVEFGPDGRPVRMLGSMFDITELENARAALHERDAKLSRILEAAPEAIIIADEQGRIVLFNEGAQDVFGYTPEETVGQTIAMLMPERFRAAHSGHVRGFASGGDVQKRMGDRNEIAGVRKNGEEFPARATISKLESADGLIYSVWLRDVTRSKAIREELLAAKAAAEAASAAKSNFIANMSHELRTPLNAILGFSEVMGMETFGPLGHERYREYTEDIKKSGEHLLSIINDILNVSQLEAGKMRLTDVEAVDVIDLVEDCIKWVSPKADAAGVELAFDGGDGVPALRGERRLLAQVLLNLLSNAVKFSPKGGTVEITAEEDTDDRVRISVRDSGAGMTPEQLARIGEPFLQFGEARSRKFEGTGLGLSIAKRLVELHGGKLESFSAPNEGTIFTMVMPAEMQASRSADAAKAVWA